MEDKLLIAIAGGFVGGVLGVLGTLVSSYLGPRKLEEWKAGRRAQRWDNPRKRLLLNLLDGEGPKMRSIETLCRSCGTSAEECRRLLIEIEARGVRLKDGREGWVLIKHSPLDRVTEDEIYDLS